MKKVVLVLFFLSLIGCGFQPRGSLYSFGASQPVSVQSPDSRSELKKMLEQSLRRSGAQADEAATNVARLVLIAEQWHIRPLSVDTQISAREYESRYVVRFSLMGANGEPLITAQSIEMSRDYIYDVQDSFGTPGEQELIAEEIRRDMASAILLQVSRKLAAN